jgi:hypothetical protein
MKNDKTSSIGSVIASSVMPMLDLFKKSYSDQIYNDYKKNIDKYYKSYDWKIDYNNDYDYPIQYSGLEDVRKKLTRMAELEKRKESADVFQIHLPINSSGNELSETERLIIKNAVESFNISVPAEGVEFNLPQAVSGTLWRLHWYSDWTSRPVGISSRLAAVISINSGTMPPHQNEWDHAH